MATLLKDFAVAIPIGMVFGASVHLSGVSSPHVLRAQFIFEKEIMMKMFLGGLSGSALSLAVLSWLHPHAFDKARESRGFGDKGAVTAVLGGFLQGVGMALAASCPGMAFAQLGAGVETAPLTYLGGLAGASLYSYVHPWMKDHHVFDFSKTLDGKFESMHLERVFFGGQFIPSALSFAGFTLAAALGVERLAPWRVEVATLANVDQHYSLNPIVAGLILGSLQIPIFYLFNSFLGASSGYSVTTSQVLRFLPEGILAQYAYAKKFIRSKAVWQVGMGIGIVLGAAWASGYANEVYDAMSTGSPLSASRSAPHVSKLEAFIGGILIVFSARFVGGCASGHGLSGLPSLHVISWLTVPSMFAGAIFAGNVMSRLFMTKADYLLYK